MSFEHYHTSLGKDALTAHVLKMQLIMSNAIRQLTSTIEHPNAISVGHRLNQLSHNLICETHAQYILGNGPKATQLLNNLVRENPNRDRSSLFNEGIKPLLPLYKTPSLDDKDKDRSTNRHWATMVRVGFGADEHNKWNRDVLDEWFKEGRIQTVKDFSLDRDSLELPGARLLRGQSGDEHFYCVRIITQKYNKNMLTLTETVAPVDAAVYVSLEDIWATHDDFGLIDDEELEGYITELLTQYGVNETPLPVLQKTEAANDGHSEQPVAVED